MDALLKYRLFESIKGRNCLKIRKCFQSYNRLINERKPKTKLSAKWIRNSFIDYFVSKHNHLFVKSSSVVPEKDSSLLLVNAGMNQFKPIFQNRLSPTDSMNAYIRCVNSQKCIRVGGKHCDLSAVGTDGRHHTFFEMLGNWSFGDYYKKESCLMAWDLLTQVYKLDPNRLVVTYFGGDKQLGLGPDVETKDIWLQIGLAKDRVIPLGANENFWEMGETGPCGICTEIHYLLEPNSAYSCDHLLRNSIEIWNIVFMQFDKAPDGKLNPLHKHFVDTGMGLERIVSVIQNVDSNYATDLFVPYFQCIQNISKCKPYTHSAVDPLDISYRIIADHSRMFTIAISDGLKPSYRGTGFILRKIIRKSIGISANDFHISNARQLLCELTALTVDLLGEAFPELQKNIKHINDVIEEEILRYESVVSENKRLVKALNRIDIKYSIDLSQEISDKLKKIQNEFELKLKDNSIDKRYIESNKTYLFSIKDIISDYTINLRHNLPMDLNERVDQLMERIDNFEKHLIYSFSKEFQSIIDSNKSLNYFVHKIQTTGDTSIAFKIGLDHFGHRPTALFHSALNSNEFYIQTTVPNDYQKYLSANEWMSQISKRLNSFELLSKKRSKKLSSLRSQSTQQMDDAISCAKHIADNCFKS